MRLKVRKKWIINYYITFCSLVDQLAIVHNPAYEEGMQLLIIALYPVIVAYTVHRLKMRSRRVELESNPSYITVQPNRTCTADYENIIT